jgi:hypothetical protein
MTVVYPGILSRMTAIDLVQFADGVPELAYSMPPEDSFGVESATFVLGDEKRVCAVTDRGTVIPLFRYEAMIRPSQVGAHRFDPERDLPSYLAFLESLFLKNVMKVTSWVERVAPINPAANCHGWIFTRGQFGVDDSYVPVILAEQGYKLVQEPQVGDIAIYCYESGKVGHSGLVQFSAPHREIMIESKWGPFSVFTHPLHAYSGIWSFYRSNRSGHCLTIRRCESPN